MLTFSPNIALTHTEVATAISASVNQNTSKFSQIEQPLRLKLLVALGGMGLIVAELWWFVFSKTKSR